MICELISIPPHYGTYHVYKCELILSQPHYDSSQVCKFEFILSPPDCSISHLQIICVVLRSPFDRGIFILIFSWI